MRLLMLTALVFGTLATGACQSARSVTSAASSTLGRFDPIYRPDVVQGNFVSSEQVAALQIGMNKQQVKQILGTPLLTDIFHAQRWDYVFTIARKGQKFEQSKRLTLFFKDDALDRIEGDVMPSESEFIRQIDSPNKARPVMPPLTATDKQLQDFAKQNPQPRTSQPSTPANPENTETPQKSYPALEKTP